MAGWLAWTTSRRGRRGTWSSPDKPRVIYVHRWVGFRSTLATFLDKFVSLRRPARLKRVMNRSAGPTMDHIVSAGAEISAYAVIQPGCGESALTEVVTPTSRRTRFSGSIASWPGRLANSSPMPCRPGVCPVEDICSCRDALIAGPCAPASGRTRSEARSGTHVANGTSKHCSRPCQPGVHGVGIAPPVPPVTPDSRQPDQWGSAARGTEWRR